MSRTRTTIAALAAAAALLAPGTGHATGSGDATAELQQLCTMKGGLWVWTPYALARCQDSRANKGFEREAEQCAELGGSLLTVDSAFRNKRVSWSCLGSAG